jgi:uncharacterized protein
VLVSAFLWQGTPNKLIEVATEGEVQLFTSRVLLDELTEVLHRKKFESAVSATGLMAGELVSLYRRLAYRVTARKPLTPI